MASLCVTYGLQGAESHPKSTLMKTFERFAKKTPSPANSSQPTRKQSLSSATARSVSLDALDARKKSLSSATVIRVSLGDENSQVKKETKYDENMDFLIYKPSADLEKTQGEEEQKRTKNPTSVASQGKGKCSCWKYWCTFSDGEIFSKSGK